MTENRLSSWLVLLSSLLVFQTNFHPTSGKRRVVKAQNNVIDVKTECSINNMNVTFTLEHQFQGVVYARGFPLECRALGSGDNTVTLQLTASGCGVRITPHEGGGLLYSVLVDIQMAKHLQQVSDPVMPATCLLTEDKMVLHSLALHVDKPKSRSGRMMSHPEDPQPKAWLEIEGSQQYQGGAVNVGEHTTILVKTWLPENISSQAVDCVAHDGLGETSQALTDPVGCPVDAMLVPRFLPSPDLSQTRGDYRFTVQATSFPAFKFPDRDSVLIRCGLQLCRGPCILADCSADSKSRHRHQRKIKGEEGEILDYIQVFNSVEVVAPGIEMDDLRQPYQSRTTERGRFPGDLLSADFDAAPFCLSAPRMAVVFAALGVVFLAAVAVSLYVMLKNRLLKEQYTDGRLVSRDSLSLIIGQNSRSSLSAWSYGRI